MGADFAVGIATKRTSVFRVVAGVQICGLIFHAGAGPGSAANRCCRGPRCIGESLLDWRTRLASLLSTRDLLLGAWAPGRASGVGGHCNLAGAGRVGRRALPYACYAPVVLAVVSIWFIARYGIGRPHRGLGLAVLAGVMFGVLLISGRQAGLHGGVFWPLVAARAASTVLMFGIVAFSASDSRPIRAALVPIVLSGVLDSGANALFIAATRHGRLDVAAVLSSLYPASTVILARLLLNGSFAGLNALAGRHAKGASSLRKGPCPP